MANRGKQTTPKAPRSREKAAAEVLVRRAELSDVPALITMSEELFHYHKAFHEEYYALSKVARDYWRGKSQYYLSGRSGVVFVAERGGQIIGYIVGAIEKRPPVYLMEHVGRIGPIFVASRHRGRGVAKHLIRAALDWFRNKPVSHIEANMDARNAPGIKLFTRAGFRVHQTKFLKEC
ncbi:MAG: GNAT family N-acetyltransferase [Candidatus Colwellbacteria bacterium]|nr:GNAT family N-acetyltransferase [Candidatus Colwellbacteria bacterium]